MQLYPNDSLLIVILPLLPVEYREGAVKVPARRAASAG
jgi:hypothetical protein